MTCGFSPLNLGLLKGCGISLMKRGRDQRFYCKSSAWSDGLGHDAEVSWICDIVSDQGIDEVTCCNRCLAGPRGGFHGGMGWYVPKQAGEQSSRGQMDYNLYKRTGYLLNRIKENQNPTIEKVKINTNLQ